MSKKRISEKQKQVINTLLLKASVEEVYQMVLDGTLDHFPYGFWAMPENHDYAEKCLRYLLEKVLKWSEDDIKEKLSSGILEKYKLATPRTRLYSSLYKYLDAAYPGKYNPWEMKALNVQNYWNRETRIKALRWLYTENHE